MKITFKYIAILSVLAFSLAGCTKFLERDTREGLEESDIFGTLTTAQAYLDRAMFNLDRQFHIDFMGNDRSHNSQLSDECATTANTTEAHSAVFMNLGNWLLPRNNSADYEMGVSNGGAAIFSKAVVSLRVCNRVLALGSTIPDATETEIERLLGQAHFLRAWWYFELIRRWGGMPIFDKVMTDKADSDLPRETYLGSHEWMVQDIDEAIGLLPDEWEEGNFGRPNKVAAMALRSMTELYAASPLMQNDLQSTEIKPYDRERAKSAAALAQDVLDYISSHSDVYRLIGNAPGDNFRVLDQNNNDLLMVFYWPGTMPGRNPEHLWYNRMPQNPGGTGGIRTFCLTPLGTSTQNGANAAILPTPTLNFVNMFDKKGADGRYYPIVDARAGYTIEDPYKDRDPRFYQFILYPGGSPWGSYAAASGGNRIGDKYVPTIHVGGFDYQQLLRTGDAGKFTNVQSQQQTGLRHRKVFWYTASEGTNQDMNYNWRTVFIRVAQIYLDLAEASFEATGSATAVVEGCSMSALEALNAVRARWGLTGIAADIAADPVKFREAYRRERAVELFMESHRWFDIRRWMIAHELFNPTGPVYGIPSGFSGTSPIWGMRTEVKTGTVNNPTSFTYTPYPMTNVIRSFGMRNYWYPFTSLTVASQENLVQNPGW